MNNVKFYGKVVRGRPCIKPPNSHKCAWYPLDTYIARLTPMVWEEPKQLKIKFGFGMKHEN